MAYYSRRNPWPFHLTMNGVGLLLGASKPGAPQLVSTKMQDITQVAPPDFSYGGTSPISDRQEPYESLGMGIGLHMQEKWQDYRYASAEAVDLSVWPWCKGPLLHSYIPTTRDSSAGIRAFFELNGVLYAANGRYVLRKAVGDTWSVVKDFGATASILNVAVFTTNFDGIQRAWFALSAGPAQWTADGTTYTPMATFASLGFLAIGREFWWADDVNRLRKVDTNADPTVEANYTNLIFRVGDKQASITNLVTTSVGTMLILKTDGIYTLDSAGDDHAALPLPEVRASTRQRTLHGAVREQRVRQLRQDVHAPEPGPVARGNRPRKADRQRQPGARPGDGLHRHRRHVRHGRHLQPRHPDQLPDEVRRLREPDHRLPVRQRLASWQPRGRVARQPVPRSAERRHPGAVRELRGRAVGPHQDLGGPVATAAWRT